MCVCVCVGHPSCIMECRVSDLENYEYSRFDEGSDNEVAYHDHHRGLQVGKGIAEKLKVAHANL